MGFKIDALHSDVYIIIPCPLIYSTFEELYMKSVRFLVLALMLLLPAISPAKETKDVSFSFKNAEAVIFSHDGHLAIYKNNCRICHNAIFDLRKKAKFTMADMEKTKSCGACH